MLQKIARERRYAHDAQKEAQKPRILHLKAAVAAEQAAHGAALIGVHLQALLRAAAGDTQAAAQASRAAL